VPIDLGAKNRVRQCDLADFLSFQINYVYYWHFFFSLRPW